MDNESPKYKRNNLSGELVHKGLRNLSLGMNNNARTKPKTQYVEY